MQVPSPNFAAPVRTRTRLFHGAYLHAASVYAASVRAASFGAALLLAAVSAGGQTHRVEKQQPVVRAIGVYEFTGSLDKPDASRLIPVSLYIEGQLQDAAYYLARPVPFALQTGNVYSLDMAGTSLGTYNLLYSRHLQTSDLAAYDDGWFGYGEFKAPAAPKPVKLKAASTQPVLSRNGKDVTPADDEDDDTPHLIRRAGGEATDAPPPATASTSTTSTSTATPEPSAGADGKVTEDTSKTPDANDADRPTLRRRSPQEQKDTAKKRDQASVKDVGSLNDDPDRPSLHRGRPAGAISGDDLPKLSGLPKDMHQLTAVSDATDRPPHSFARPFENASERATILALMEGLARTQVAAYDARHPAPAPTVVAADTTAAEPPDEKPRLTRKSAHPAVPGTPPAPVASTGTTAAKRAAAAKQKAAGASATAAKQKAAAGASATGVVRLDNEQLTGYTLSYGGAATFVYMAESPSVTNIPAGSKDSATRYVTVIAQADLKGVPQLAMQSVTDAAHLDRTPWMRLVDAVDPDDSNRASLLLELRAQTTRQFALYRVIAAKSEQIFVSASTQ